MNTRVILKERVRDFIQTLAPEPRRKLVSALKDLAADNGDVLQLEGDLHPLWPLKVDRMRMIFEPRAVAGERHLICLFAEHRATVYAILGQMLAAGLRTEDWRLEKMMWR